LGLFLREYRQMTWAFLILSGWGAAMAGLMWWQGPWMKHMVPFYWPIQAAAFVHLAIWSRRPWRAQIPFPAGTREGRNIPAEAA
jgi:hypothetical protein